MQKEIYDLLKIGLTEGEAKVYIALVELGSSTVGPVVKKAGVAYSNVYDILNRLIEKGIVTFIIKEKTKYFQASSAINLVEFLDRKETEIQKQKRELKKILPDIEKLQENKPEQEAEVFIGKNGLRTVYEKLLPGLDKKEEVLYFYIHEKEYAEEADLFYLGIKDLLKKVNMRGISNKEGRKSKFFEYFVNKSLKKKFVDFPIPGNIEIYNDKLLIISWKKPIIAVLIKSKSITDNFREYFEGVWKIAKKI